MTSIDFSELIPERLRVNNLPDGTSMELMHRDELGPDEIAAVQGMQRRIEALQAQLNEADEEKSLEIIRQMVVEAGHILKLLSPGLSDETLATLKMGHRANIIQWWVNQMPAVEANGNGSPKADARRRRSSKQRV